MPLRLRHGVCATAVAVLVALWPLPSKVAGAASLPSNCTVSGAIVTCAFAYNGTTGADGSAQLFVVPPGVETITVEAWGAQGGGPVGGLGGHVRGTVGAIPGEVLVVRAGGRPTGAPGGFNGGGNTVAVAPGGGGASDVRRGADTVDDRIFVAGGGGGAGFFHVVAADGGAGGGLEGGAGSNGSTGGTQTDGGTGTTSKCFGTLTTAFAIPGGNGSAGRGGDGGQLACNNELRFAGSGGGGGFFGGGGGGATAGCVFFTCGLFAGSGAGGSGFVTPSATGTVNEAGVRSGNGLVQISYLDTPPDKEACKNDGWRNYVDANGNAFRNQGQCVAWVLHNA